MPRSAALRQSCPPFVALPDGLPALDEPPAAARPGGAWGRVPEHAEYRVDADTEGSPVPLPGDIRARTIPMRVLSPLIRRQVERNFTVNVARFEVMLNELAAVPGPLG